jgi:hypothetical protein
MMSRTIQVDRSLNLSERRLTVVPLAYLPLETGTDEGVTQCGTARLIDRGWA